MWACSHSDWSSDVCSSDLGIKTKGIETTTDIQARKDFLRKIGYKL
jgi:adenosine/AMP kinase